MKYEIKPAVSQHRQHLTPAQRTSSLFSESPTVMGKVLRRGQSLVVTDKDMAHHENQLKRLIDAGSITITPLGVPDFKKPEPVVVKPPESLPVVPEVTEPPPVDPGLTTAPEKVEAPVATAVETVVVTDQVTVAPPTQTYSKKNKKG